MSSRVVTELSVPAGASFTAGDVDGQGVGTLIQIDSGVGSATVITHLEGEVGIRCPVGISHGGVLQLPSIEVHFGDRSHRRLTAPVSV